VSVLTSFSLFNSLCWCRFHHCRTRTVVSLTPPSHNVCAHFMPPIVGFFVGGLPGTSSKCLWTRSITRRAPCSHSFNRTRTPQSAPPTPRWKRTVTDYACRGWTEVARWRCRARKRTMRGSGNCFVGCLRRCQAPPTHRIYCTLLDRLATAVGLLQSQLCHILRFYCSAGDDGAGGA
jgi:hypothetical protein